MLVASVPARVTDGWVASFKMYGRVMPNEAKVCLHFLDQYFDVPPIGTRVWFEVHDKEVAESVRFRLTGEWWGIKVRVGVEERGETTLLTTDKACEQLGLERNKTYYMRLMY